MYKSKNLSVTPLTAVVGPHGPAPAMASNPSKRRNTSPPTSYESSLKTKRRKCSVEHERLSQPSRWSKSSSDRGPRVQGTPSKKRQMASASLEPLVSTKRARRGEAPLSNYEHAAAPTPQLTVEIARSPTEPPFKSVEEKELLLPSTTPQSPAAAFPVITFNFTKYNLPTTVLPESDDLCTWDEDSDFTASGSPNASKQSEAGQEQTDNESRRRLEEKAVRLLQKREVDEMRKLGVSEVGDGAYASCCKARDPHSGEEVVIKTFEKGDLAGLVTEAVNLKDMQNVPGMQRLVGVCIETLQLVSQFAGSTAYKYFTTCTSFAEAVNIFLQVSQTLIGMNREGFAHNDIKYNNICVSVKDSGPVATVIDVGMSRPVGSEWFFPTPRYVELFPWIAPELLMHTGTCGESTDAYGFAHFMDRVLGLEEGRGHHSASVDALAGWIDAALHNEPSSRPSLTALVELLQVLNEEEPAGLSFLLGQGSLMALARRKVVSTPHPSADARKGKPSSDKGEQWKTDTEHSGHSDDGTVTAPQSPAALPVITFNYTKYNLPTEILSQSSDMYEWEDDSSFTSESPSESTSR